MKLSKITVLFFLLTTGSYCFANFSEGLAAYDLGNYQEAHRLWSQSATKGDLQSQFNLAVIYEQGLGVEKNLQKAFFWYLKAAIQGDIDAQAMVAAMFEFGNGTEKNLYEARKWYSRIARQDSKSTDSVSLIAAAKLKLMSLPQPEKNIEVKFEGGRFLFSEASDGYCLIALQGTITNDTTLKFKQVVNKAKLLGCEKNSVLLESRGGSMFDGFELGKEMRFEGYRTVVRDSCASACGLIFMGGTERVMFGNQARIGLHQPRTIREKESFCANQMDGNGIKELRSFLKFMIPETSDRVFETIMKTPCEKMTWVKGSQTIEYGIATQLDVN